MDNVFNSLTWSTGWMNNNRSYATPRNGWDHRSTNGWSISGDSDGSFGTTFAPEEQPQTIMNARFIYGAVHQGQHEIHAENYSY